MSSLSKFWRIPAFVLALALPLAVGCADDEGATPRGQDPTPTTGTISGTVTAAADGSPIVGALVGTSPATTTALTDAQGNYSITNVPIPSSGSASFAVTASKEGFNAASTSVTLSEQSPTATANLQLTQPTQPPPDTQGNLNVLVTNRNGDAQDDADVTVRDAGGTEVASAETDANGFALFTDLDAGSYTVTATKTISGFQFQASAGANVNAGETSFIQLTLRRDLDQTVFPNIDGESITLGDGSDIELVPVLGGDSNPEVDCNIIRTQHMFVAEVRNEDGDLVSGVKVEWDLNISENGTITVECPELTDDPAGCNIPTVPGNTGSIVDTDDPDLDPVVARSGMSPAFKVDSRNAVTFTNDGAQTVSFGSSNVTVGTGQTWIVITSPVEGVTDVIVSTPDIPKTNPNCAIDDPGACDKEFAIKRWVNWDTAVYEVEWPDQEPADGWQPGPSRDIRDAADATFNEISQGGTVTNILNRRTADANDPDEEEGLNPSYTDVIGCATDNDAASAPNTPANACELVTNRTLFMSEVRRLRSDSPFNLSRGRMVWNVTDDSPDIDFWGENANNNGDGCLNGVCNAENNGPSDDQYWVGVNGPGGLITTRNEAWVEFDANNNAFDGGVITQNPLCSAPCDEDDFIGWGIVETRLDPATYYCVDVNGDGICNPGGPGQTDTFSTAYQRLLANTIDNQNALRVRFIDEFGEVCADFNFNKRWVTSRLTIIKNVPGATRVTQEDGVSAKTHTVQVGQSFSYTITVINDGEVRSENVRITDTLPRMGTQFSVPHDPGDRSGPQAFQFLRDRPAFDPTAVVYAIDDDNASSGNSIDRCIRGDDGTTAGDAYTAPAVCPIVEDPAPGTKSVQQARDEAIDLSNDGDQVVWIQWFDDEVLSRTQVGGGVQSEDSVEVFLSVNQSYSSLPDTFCNIATVTDGPDNLTRDDRPQSFDADTLCHEVREALLDVRKTAEDAVITAGGDAVWTVEIANNGSASLTNVVIHDTVDQSLAAGPLTEDDITLASGFTDATVTINPDSFSFQVAIGTLAPTGFVDVFTVSVETDRVAGTFCNRVTARGTNPAGTLVETDISCITTTVAIEMDISNEDGFIDAGGVFQSNKEIFTVGETGDDFAYQVIITNQSTFTATGVEVTDLVAPNTGIFTYVDGRTGFPTRGTISGESPTGFFWDIGTLGPGESAEYQFFANAERAGDDVNRVVMDADQLTGTKTNEEPTSVTD